MDIATHTVPLSIEAVPTAGGRNDSKIHANSNSKASSTPLQSAVRAHAGVKCRHADVTAGGPQKGQPTYVDALTSGCMHSMGLPLETFTFPLVCTVYDCTLGGQNHFVSDGMPELI